MKPYTYTEARQNLAGVLDNAESAGKVVIRRKDGRTFALTPERSRRSPLDVPSIRTDITTEEIVKILRKERSRVRVGSRRA